MLSIHDQSISQLAPADYRLIQREHEQLGKLLQDLHEVCCRLDDTGGTQSANREILVSCRGLLASYFYDLLALTETHFEDEEAIMLKRPQVTAESKHYQSHCRAHDRMMRELETLVLECSALNKKGSTADGYRLLYDKVSGLFVEHTREFDDPFIQSTLIPVTAVESAR
jgi:hemerythrin